MPNWKYVAKTRIFRLHVPRGYTSALFSHLPSRTVFIDADRYFGESLGYWLAHELGHLLTNSAKEQDAERAAREFRKRLRDPQRQDPHWRLLTIKRTFWACATITSCPSAVNSRLTHGECVPVSIFVQANALSARTAYYGTEIPLVSRLAL